MLDYGAVQNKDKSAFVRAEPANLTAAARAILAEIPEDLTFNLINRPGKDSYPITGVIYAVCSDRQSEGIANRSSISCVGRPTRDRRMWRRPILRRCRRNLSSAWITVSMRSRPRRNRGHCSSRRGVAVVGQPHAGPCLRVLPSHTYFAESPYMQALRQVLQRRLAVA